jgi:hypothetical protein
VTRGSSSSVRCSRPALGFGRCCAVLHPRFAVFPRRPSSSRSTDQRSSLAVQPSSGSLPGRLARLHGRLSWVFGPCASTHFQRSAQEPSPSVDFTPEELARALAAVRRLLPRGLPAVGDGRLRATSLALCRPRPKSRALTLQSLLRRRRSPPLARLRSPSEVLGSSSYRPTKTTLRKSRSRGKPLTFCPQLRARAIAVGSRVFATQAGSYKSFSHNDPQPVESARSRER